MSDDLIAPLDFDRLPSMAQLYPRFLLQRRKSTLRPGQSVPRIAAHIEEVRVDPSHLQLYQRVCALPQTATLPLSYPQVLAGGLHGELLGHPKFPLPVLGVVHLRNEVVSYGPLHLNDPLDITTHLDGHREVKNGIEVDIHTEVDVHRDLRWRSVITMLFRKRSKSKELRVGATPQRANEGELLRSVLWHVPEDLGRRYAAATGDFNPIHLFALSAKLFGFRRHIAQGMWSFARSLAELDNDLPAVPYKVEVAFKRPIFLPSTVQFSARRDAMGLGFELRTEDGRKEHMVGRAEPLAAAI